jgi:hypothetical protein
MSTDNPGRAQSNGHVHGAVRLDAESIDAIAQRVAEILRSEASETREALITAADVAARFGVSRTWVYENAERLGAIRLGTGSKARLRFDSRRVSELVGVRPGHLPQTPRRPLGRGPAWLDGGDLIPIRAY